MAIVTASIETTPKRYVCRKILSPDNSSLYEVIPEIAQLTFFKSSLFLTRNLYEQASCEIEKIMIRMYLLRFARRFEVSASGILKSLRGSKNLKVVPYTQRYFMFSCLVKEHSAYALSNVNSMEALQNSSPT